MSRTLLAAVVASFATFTHAQPIDNAWNTPPTTPLVVTLLPTVGSEALAKELKLTADQVKRLTAFRQKQWDTTYTTPTKDLKAADTNKAVEAEFAAVLSADQLKRARQIALQLAWNDNTPFRGVDAQAAVNTHVVPLGTLRDHPEVGAALHLDESQKSVFQSPAGFAFAQVLYLTPAQSAAAKDLLGPPFAGPVTYQYDTRGSRFGGFGRPIYAMPALQLTLSPDVQKDLKLTAEQIAALDEIRNKYSNTRTERGGGRGPRAANADLSPEARQKADEMTRADVIAATDKILTAEQRKRLDQLPRQGVATRTLFLPGNDYGKELDVTTGQRKAFTDAQAAHDAAVAKVVLSDEPLEQVKAKVKELDKENTAAVEAILTPAQQAKWKELAGAEFKGRYVGPGIGGFGGGGPGGGGFSNPPPTLLAARERSFGLYTTQLSQLTLLPGLQAELKMTEEQVKKVTDASQEAMAQFRRASAPGDDEAALKQAFAERSAFIEKSLADILTKEQQARLREVFLQQLDMRVTSPFANSFGAVGYPGVAEAVKLTADQKKKILAGERSADVLTDEQKKAIQGMLGKTADLPTIFANPRPPRSPVVAVPPTHSALLDTTLWDELKLTPEQITKLVPALNEYTAQSSRSSNWGGPGGATAADPAKTKAAIDALVAAADATLTAGQKKRLGQLALQQRAASSLAIVFGVPAARGVSPGMDAQNALQKELGLTNEQMTKINTLAADATERSTLVGRNSPFNEFATWSDTRTRLRDRLDDRVLKELTPAQAAKWKEMLGEPYKGFAKQPVPPARTPGGGFGGPGGGVGSFGP